MEKKTIKSRAKVYWNDNKDLIIPAFATLTAIGAGIAVLAHALSEFDRKVDVVQRDVNLLQDEVGEEKQVFPLYGGRAFIAIPNDTPTDLFTRK